MRSQIGGLTQGVKNAQDGISMIQTFEGALTETDSILQRMKTLADQAANGTYQDDVDRDAIQLEFDQLNDELNQIADTDFNGVIVLNGGVMSDGVKADPETGLIDYAAAKAEGSKAPVDIAKQTTSDRTTNESAGAILDNSDYDGDAANALWDALGLDVKDVKQLNITWQKNGDSWKAVAATKGEPGKEAVDDTFVPGTAAVPASLTSAKDGSGTNITAITFNANAADVPTTDTTLVWDDMNGNWTVNGVADATLNAKTSINGKYGLSGATNGNIDPNTTIIIKAGTAAVPDQGQHGSAAVASTEKDITNKILDKINAAITVKATDNGGFTVSWKDKDGNTHDVNNVFGAYKAVDGDYITNSFTNTDDKSYAPTNIAVAEDSLKATIAANPGSPLNAVPEGTIKVAIDPDLSDDKMTQKLSEALDELKTISFSADETGALTLTGNTAIQLNADGKTLEYDSDGAGTMVAIGTVEVDATKLTGIAAGDTIEFKLNVDDYKYVANADVKANSIETSDIAKKVVEGLEVSKSDAFDNSKTLMSYRDSIILQAGARTKDAVEFTFKYSSSGIGTLQANMDCSSRAGGLNTSNLSLKTAKDANAAIDQIDHAINKVSMVRATFGSIQNRLEHKIDNMNVTKENLTSAESRIRDTNIAEEMANFTKNQILSQASQSMLAQANSLPQGALQLLG